ncbi:MAG: LytR family transcriptional regulator [Ruminococcaceae bacterium]|nr:LytR family transcriptional regulator [Oscillospiraceae bacterium]
MKRYSGRRQRKQLLYGILWACLISLTLILSAILLDRARGEDSLPTMAPLIPKVDKTVLILGKDAVGSNTDVMLLCRLDGKGGKATVLQLPRDTVTAYDGRLVKLNSLYGRLLSACRKETKKNPEQKALTRLTALLSEHLGVAIDEYVLMDLKAFRETVDAIGGVPMEVPCDLDYDDPEQGLHIHLKKGNQVLDGAMAEQFIRYRAGYVRADLGRVDAQKLFLAAFIKRVQEGLTLPTILSVGETMLTHTVTSLGVEELPGVAATALSIPLSAIRMMTAPGEITSTGRYYVLNREGMQLLTVAYFKPTEAGFDPNRFFCGRDNDEILGLYGRPYEAKPLPDAEAITENGLSIAVRSQ